MNPIISLCRPNVFRTSKIS